MKLNTDISSQRRGISVLFGRDQPSLDGTVIFHRFLGSFKVWLCVLERKKRTKMTFYYCGVLENVFIVSDDFLSNSISQRGALAGTFVSVCV